MAEIGEVPEPPLEHLEEAEEEPQNEGLLENDLYLLTQGADAGQDFGGLPEGRRPERSKRRKRTKDSHPAEARGEVGQMEPLALPAPADAEGHEAEPEAPGSEAPEASPTGDTPKEKVPQSPEELAAEMERARKRKKFESKPVEAKKEGDEDMDWIHFPSLAAAGRETGVPNSSIASLCTMQGSHTGWIFRWPGATRIAKPTPPRRPELPPEETEVILRRLRAMSAEERRNALAAMPEETRKELMKHLKQEAGGSRLRQLLSHLPELLEGADEQKRHELMQGVRMLESVTAQVLAAPDMAAVVKILRELTPQQRHAIVESLPNETQEALAAHLRAEKAASAAQHSKAYTPAQQSLLPALCRML